MRTHPPFLLCLAGACAASLPAQGHFVWPDPSRPLDGMLVRTALDRYELYLPGWTTRAGGAGDNNGSEATGIGIPNSGVIRRVSSADFVDEEDGETADAPLFPFTASAVASQAFAALVPTRQWSGFVANVTQPVPDYVRGVLAFELESAASPADVIAALAQSVVAVAEANPDGTLTGVRQQLLQAPQVVRARMLYLKFDRGAGDFALNYESFGRAPRIAPLTSTAGQPWAAGRFGGALRGGDINARVPQQNVCDPGLDGEVFGTLTAAWWMRERNAPGTAVSHLFGQPGGGLRCFTGGSAGQGLACTGFGGGQVTLAADVQALARAGWVHLALVLDGGAGRATFYVNGQARPPVPISGVSIPDRGTILIGGIGAPATASVYDIDEFRLWNAAVPAAIVQSWAQQPDAAATTLGTTCGGILRHLGSVPTRPNPAYSLRVEGPPGSPYALLIGTGQTLGALALPFPLGPSFPALQGCQLYSDLTLVLPGSITPTGLGTTPLPIPSSIFSTTLYNQAVLVAAPTQTVLTNAQASAIY